MTSHLVHQKIRTRIAEMLDWIIESETQAPALGMNALVNCWHDWVPESGEAEYFPEPVYTRAEKDLILTLRDKMNAFCAATPRSIDDDAALRLPEWPAVVAAAKFCRHEMLNRI